MIKDYITYYFLDYLDPETILFVAAMIFAVGMISAVLAYLALRVVRQPVRLIDCFRSALVASCIASISEIVFIELLPAYVRDTGSVVDASSACIWIFGFVVIASSTWCAKKYLRISLLKALALSSSCITVSYVGLVLLLV